MAYTDKQLRAFTQIAYMDLKAAFRAQVEARHLKEPLTESIPLVDLLSKDQIKRLHNLGITNDELLSWGISDVHDKNNVNGFYCCVIETGPGEATVAFRGSEGMDSLENVKHDWVAADLKLLNSTMTIQQEEARRFLMEDPSVLSQYDNITMTGHSLGGNLAEYATLEACRLGIGDKISRCVSFDGPGFSGEFIEEYSEEIRIMAGKMDHYRWSFVGSMLKDLPGVNYQYVTVSNEANHKDDKKYNIFTRHDTKYLDFDENGKLITTDEPDLGAGVSSTISNIADDLPSEYGNNIVNTIGNLWVGIMWIVDKITGEDQSHVAQSIWSTTGTSVEIINNNEKEEMKLVLSTMTAAAMIVAVSAEKIISNWKSTATAVAKSISKIIGWSAEQYKKFVEKLEHYINKATNYLRKKFNKAYAYSLNNTQIKVDTDKLRDYANRIESLNRRIASIDGRLDSLYWSVGLVGLYNLIVADILISYSKKLADCVSYLDMAANEFDALEKELYSAIH